MSALTPRHILALSLLLLGAACGQDEPGRMPAGDGPADVAVSMPSLEAGLLAFPATAEAASRAEISTRMSGTIERVAVDVGSRVRRGELLVRMDAGDVEAGIRSAEAALRQARRSFERLEALERDGAATGHELDEARARFEVAEAAVREARAQEAYTALTAPFTGVVAARMADPGDLARPGRPILILIQEGTIKVVADVPAEVGARVTPGDPAIVVDPGSGARRAAHVARMAPAVQTAARRLRVEATLDESMESDQPILPGAFLRLELGGGGRSLWIPKDALVRRGQLTGAYVIEEREGEEGDRLRLRWIRLGETRGEAVEVLAGLDPAEQVVRSPAPALVDGQPVGSIEVLGWTPAVGPIGGTPDEDGR